MTAENTPFPAHPAVDPERTPVGNVFNNADGYSGQEYTRQREETMGQQDPSGHPPTGGTSAVDVPAEDADGRDIPPQNGGRASFDPMTGEVRGSGMGAGGGQDGEDFDEETSGGS